MVKILGSSIFGERIGDGSRSGARTLGAHSSAVIDVLLVEQPIHEGCRTAGSALQAGAGSISRLFPRGFPNHLHGLKIMSRRAVGSHNLCEADGSSIAAVEKYDGSVLAAGVHQFQVAIGRH